MTTDENGRFEFEGKVFKLVDETGCTGCYFDKSEIGCDVPDNFPDCTNRIFILVEDE